MTLEQTPRILAPHLQAFQHKLVRMLGKVLQLRGDTAVIDAGGNVDLILNRVRHKTSYSIMTSTKCVGGNIQVGIQSNARRDTIIEGWK